MADDAVLPIPNLALAQDYFVLSSPSLAHLHENARKSLLEGIQADRMYPNILLRVLLLTRYVP